MMLVWKAQIGLWSNPFYAHFMHMALYLLAIYKLTFALQASRDAPRAVERALRIDLIYSMLQGDRPRRGLNWLVIESGSVQP